MTTAKSPQNVTSADPKLLELGKQLEHLLTRWVELRLKIAPLYRESRSKAEHSDFAAGGGMVDRLHEYSKALEKALKQNGCKSLLKGLDRLEKQIESLASQIIRIRARTLDSLRARALADFWYQCLLDVGLDCTEIHWAQSGGKSSLLGGISEATGLEQLLAEIENKLRAREAA